MKKLEKLVENLDKKYGIKNRIWFSSGIIYAVLAAPQFRTEKYEYAITLAAASLFSFYLSNKFKKKREKQKQQYL